MTTPTTAETDREHATWQAAIIAADSRDGDAPIYAQVVAAVGYEPGAGQ